MIAAVVGALVALTTATYVHAQGPTHTVPGIVSVADLDPGRAWLQAKNNAYYFATRTAAQTGASPALVGGNVGRSLAANGVVDASWTAVGRRVGGFSMRWVGGAAFIGGSLLTAALTYIYDQAQLATGTPLDDWYGAQGWMGLPAPVWPSGEGQPTNIQEIRDATQAAGQPNSCDIGNISVQVFHAGGGNWSWSSTATRSNGPQVWSAFGPSNGYPAAPGQFASIPHGQDWTTARLLTHYQEECNPGPSAQTLSDHLAANPTSADALDNFVIPRYLEDTAQDASWPYTRAQPWGPAGGVELDPAPNMNQWYMNPYTDPTLDTDGDGWTDAQEATAGTDFMDPNHYPDVDPYEPTDPGADPYPDADGDGIPDQFDPCPFHVYNTCAAMQPSELEIPDDYAREPTQQQLLTEQSQTTDAVDRVADLLESDPGGTPVLDPFVAPEPDISPLEAWLPDFEPVQLAWQNTLTEMQLDVLDLVETAETRFPFAFASLLGSVPTFGDSECVVFDFSLMEEQSAVNLCANNPIDGLLSTTGRAILAGLALLGFVWATVDRVLKA